MIARPSLRALCWVFLLFMLGPVSAGAEVVVLVHGYLGDRDSWAEAEIPKALTGAGWVHGGHVLTTPQGARLQPFTRRPVTPSFFAVELPSEAPLAFQAGRLADAMAELTRHFPDQEFILVGHSAGGVVARLYVVTQPEAPVGGLVTIASPHLGTSKAGLGLMAGQSPLGMMAPFVGLGGLNRSQGLFADLLPARPRSTLFWLNHQEHPDIPYVSIVRREGGWKDGDLVVPEASQHLGNVPALQGRARSVMSDGGHLLTPRDGPLLVRILAGL
ncbi:MAG: alpha/beta fold hydrolase [Gammaproteobacteria bacterium]|nr:alpha/beta fold hydrolase [Gammaproteobacteria bacterium]